MILSSFLLSFLLASAALACPACQAGAMDMKNLLQSWSDYKAPPGREVPKEPQQKKIAKAIHTK